MNDDRRPGFVVKKDDLPLQYPTHLHPPSFWEQLGRTVATYGLLEETLGRAIFALTGTRKYKVEEADVAYAKWLPTLQKALSDPLGGLIDSFAKALREHGEVGLENPDDLVTDLRAAARLRNVLCHGSWRPPDANGKSIPFFVTSKMEIFNTGVDEAYLIQTQAHVAELIVEVINSVTHMGWRFPGSLGPGEQIW
jgi:hypothetical protein